MRQIFKFVTFIVIVTIQLFSPISATAAQIGIKELQTLINERLDDPGWLRVFKSDRGSQIAVTTLEDLIDRYAGTVTSLSANSSSTRLEAAQTLLDQIFSIIPQNDRAFAIVFLSYPQQMAPFVVAIRQAVRQALRISATNEKLRIHALDLILERMNRHAALAGGVDGPAILSVFEVWPKEITGWREGERRMETEEFRRIERINFENRKLQDAMMCSQLFRPARTQLL